MEKNNQVKSITEFKSKIKDLKISDLPNNLSGVFKIAPDVFNPTDEKNTSVFITSKCYIILTSNNSFYGSYPHEINRYIKDETILNQSEYECFGAKSLNNDDIDYYNEYGEYMVGDVQNLKEHEWVIGFEINRRGDTLLDAFDGICYSVSELVDVFENEEIETSSNTPFQHKGGLEERKRAVNWLKNNNKWDLVNSYLLELGDSVRHNDLVVHLANIIYLNEKNKDKKRRFKFYNR
jgi:hypothetical protein